MSRQPRQSPTASAPGTGERLVAADSPPRPEHCASRTRRPIERALAHPDARLIRAQRLGHRVDVQRYLDAGALSKSGNVPPTARISENLKVVSESPQMLYAYESSIDEANKILEAGSRVMLDKGEKKDYDMEIGPDSQGLTTITFDDFYRVVPRYNPKVASVGGDLPRQHSPESTDDADTIRIKHEAYIDQLGQVGVDYAVFMEEVDQGRRDAEFAEMFGGVSTLDPNQWLMEASSWVGQNSLRKQVLQLELQEIAATYILEKDLVKRRTQLRRLGDSLAQFIQREHFRPNHISLPTDCARCVTYVTTGGALEDDDSLQANPDIGSNYYTALPGNAANVGWNFHWAGVILKDGGDNVTLESAGGTSLGSLGKSSWWMDLYGTKTPDQTFKKRIHQIHVRRNRDKVATMGDGPDTRKANLELNAHELAVAGWTTMTSDQ